jgi:hypothetical protein
MKKDGGLVVSEVLYCRQLELLRRFGGGGVSRHSEEMAGMMMFADCWKLHVTVVYFVVFLIDLIVAGVFFVVKGPAADATDAPQP